MEIPLFPLPLVLFPSTVLPLHIFEERYKLMIGRCVEESSDFGIVLIAPGTSMESESTIRRIGVTARMVHCDQIEDGRMNIVTCGEKRFRILEFTRSRPYWMADVEFVEEDREEGEELRESAEDVLRLYRQVVSLASKLRGANFGDFGNLPTPVMLSYMVSAILDIDTESKQMLLEMTSTTGRLKALAVHLEETIQRLHSLSADTNVRNVMKGNGSRGNPENN